VVGRIRIPGDEAILEISNKIGPVPKVKALLPWAIEVEDTGRLKTTITTMEGASACPMEEATRTDPTKRDVANHYY
jgi:hypothetical protein